MCGTAPVTPPAQACSPRLDGGLTICPNPDDPSYYSSKNIDGKLTLFPSYITHFTTEYKSDNYRITLAFDLRYE